MNKKLVAALIAVILMVATLCTSCGSSTPKSLAGTTWVYTYTAEKLKEFGVPDGATATITLVFTDETNFTGTEPTFYFALRNEEYVCMAYDEEKGTYTYKDGKFSLKNSNDIFISGTVNGDTLIMEVEGTKLVFKKK